MGFKRNTNKRYMETNYRGIVMWFDIIKVDWLDDYREEYLLGYINQGTTISKEERERLEEELSAAKERAEQLVIKTANELDYVTRQGNQIIIKPDWVNQYFKEKFGEKFGESPKREREIYFDLRDIHKKVCVKYRFVGSVGSPNHVWCLSKDNRSTAPMADSYVTVMLMARTKESWASIWGE